MVTITFNSRKKKMFVEIPCHNKTFIERSINFGGKEVNETNWEFEALYEWDIRLLCWECFGSDGIYSDLVDLKIKWVAKEELELPLYIYGREIFKRLPKGKRILYGSGIYVKKAGVGVDEEIRDLGIISTETCIIIQDFPGHIAQFLVESNENSCRIYSIVADEVDYMTENSKKKLMKLLTKINGLTTFGKWDESGNRIVVPTNELLEIKELASEIELKL